MNKKFLLTSAISNIDEKYIDGYFNMREELAKKNRKGGENVRKFRWVAPLVACFLAVFIISTMLIGSFNKSFDVFETGLFDCCTLGNHHIDLEIKPHESYKMPDMPDKEITYNGQTYLCKYVESRKNHLYGGDEESYKYKKDGITISFGINTETGFINYYYYSYYGSNGTEENKSDSDVLTQQQCTDIAYSYLKQYVDADDFSLIESTYTDMGNHGMYDFYYSRLIDGVKTSDSVLIGVNASSGIVTFHSFITLNEFKKFRAPSGRDFEKINSNISAKIDSIYESVAEEYIYTWNEDEKEYIRLADGTYAIKYLISVELTPKDTSKEKQTDPVQLLVYIK